MNMITKKNKLLNLICIFAAFSMLASCSFLFNDTLVEHPDNNVEESNIVSGARQIELKITITLRISNTPRTRNTKAIKINSPEYISLFLFSISIIRDFSFC